MAMIWLVSTHLREENSLFCAQHACTPEKIYLTGGKLQPNSAWMYSVFLAINANFHLKRQAIFSDTKDPGLSCGWGYFINEKHYKAYIGNSSAIIQERSTCVSHNAVNMADTKISKGLAATGVGTVDCAHHDMKLANGVGDLQKGEKYVYVNMDYLVFSALSTFSSLKVINFSYDIVCQWHKILWGHVPSLPLHLQPDPIGRTFRYFVPKFHLAAHIETCQMMFSLNWSPGVGRTDGEAPERGWANINRVATSTKEMGPGARRDTLDGHFGDWNWKKITLLVLLWKVIEAVRAEQEHCIALSELEDSIQKSELGASLLTKWREEIETWEVDHTKPNPFERRIDTMTQAAIRLELAKQDAKELEDGTAVSLHSEVSCSILISTGMDLEHAQRRLHADAGLLGQHPTDTQWTSILTHSNALLRCIDTWTTIQTLYMLSVANLHANRLIDLSSDDDDDDDSGCPKPNSNSGKAEDLQLLLPSEICNHVPCDRKLLEIEWCHIPYIHTSLPDFGSLDLIRSDA
ncbi:hypothetical protein EV424DRAFT_1535477 [Suillus variegatus]|nr:hypothetical protein EV424DRAFT_1535477 [Suillus variegatus]